MVGGPKKYARKAWEQEEKQEEHLQANTSAG